MLTCRIFLIRIGLIVLRLEVSLTIVISFIGNHFVILALSYTCQKFFLQSCCRIFEKIKNHHDRYICCKLVIKDLYLLSFDFFDGNINWSKPINTDPDLTLLTPLELTKHKTNKFYHFLTLPKDTMELRERKQTKTGFLCNPPFYSA